MYQPQQHFAPPPGPPPSRMPYAAPPMQSVQGVPLLAIMGSEVRNTQTNMPVFNITKSAAPGSMSSKSLITLTRPSTGEPLGTIRFTSLSTSIELTINGQTTKLKEDGVISFRYSFHPTCNPAAKWWWSDGDGDELKLTDGKKGQTIASISGNLLVCEQSFGLTERAIDEVVVSAVAAVEKKKRSKGEQGVVGEVIGAVFGA